MTVEIKYISNVSEYRRVIRHISNQSRSIYAQFKNISFSNKVTAAAPPRIVTRKSSTLTDKNTPSPNAKASPVASSISKVSQLAADLGEKIEVANHIYELLTHHYQKDHALVKRIIELVAQLINDLHDKFQEMLLTLSKQADKYMPRDFKSIIDQIGADLTTRFRSRSDSITVHYSMTSVIHEETKQPIIYYIGYILFDNLENDTMTHDYCVVVTRKSVPGKADQDYVRTLNEYKTPHWVATHDPGIPFDTLEKAYNSILVSLHAEKMLDVIEPIAIPVRRKDLKFDDPNIYSTFFNSKQGIVRLILRPGLNKQQADTIFKDSFAKLKNIVRQAHPRNKDTVAAKQPYLINYDFKTKSGIKSYETYAIDFRFAAPDDVSKTLTLTKDKVDELARIFDLSPDQQGEFIREFKRYFGTR